MKSMIKLAAVLFAATAVVSTPVLAQTVSISTLPPGAINNVQTQAIAKVVQEETGICRCAWSPSTRRPPRWAPSQAGQAAVAFMSNDEGGVAVRGKDEHEGKPLDKLELAATVFPFKVGMLVRKDSGIDSVADLKGKRFPIGWQGFPQGIRAVQRHARDGRA